jgi:Fe-S-cluster containining protein
VAQPALTQRDLLWNACRSKRCCHAMRIVLTGSDLARLVRAFELEPEDVAEAILVPEGGDGPPGFRLAPRGPAYELVLRKRGPLGPQGAPCVFLVETNDGHAACGAGDERPASCRAFPAVLAHGALRVAAPCCDCRHWTPLDVGPRERAQAEAAAEEEARHAEAVRAWNAALDAPRALDEACRHLIEACG